MASRVAFAKDRTRMAELEAAYRANLAQKGKADFLDLDVRFGFHDPTSGKKNTGYWTFGILKDAGIHVPGKRTSLGLERVPQPKPQPQPDCPMQHMEQGTLELTLEAGIWVMMVGPAGSGKTTAAKVVADKLGVKFYTQSICAQSSKADLQGYMDAKGEYNGTPFRQAFEHGGVYLLDEIDAGNPNVLTVLNAAIANLEYMFPDGKRVVAHKDFRCVAAANTYGRGADREYVGRNKLDAATLDRFAQLDWDYDERFEMRIAPRADWTRHVQKIRRAAENAGIRKVVSPRASINGGKLLNAGMAWGKVEKMILYAGLDDASVKKIKAAAN